MKGSPWPSVALWAAYCLCALPAPAALFEGEDGFVIRYPDEWAMEYGQRAGPQSGGSRRAWSVMFYDAAGGLCRESVGIAEVEQSVADGPEGASQIRQELLDVARAHGVEVRILSEGVERFAGRACPSVHYIARRRNEPSAARHWRVVIPAGARSYYVTCSACLDTFDGHEPVFRGMLETARAPSAARRIPAGAITTTALGLLAVAAFLMRMAFRAAGLR